MRLHLDAEALARHVTRTGREAKSLRPVGFRLDSEGINLAVTLPGVDYLAALISHDGNAYRDGVILLLNGEPVSVPDVADALRDTLASLPERADASEAYRDLRLAAGTSSARLSAYVLDVVRAYVRALPKRPAVSTPKAPRPAPMTVLERKHAERARRRVEERESARWALALFLADDEEGPLPTPGSRVSGADLHAYACEVLSPAVADYDEIMGDRESDLVERRDDWEEARHEYLLDAPSRPRAVSRRVLFDVADRTAAFRVTRPKGAVALTVARTSIRRLSEATAHALRHIAEVRGTGPIDPEDLADEAIAEVRALAPATAPETLDPRVRALPFQIAYAVAGDPDGVRAFGYMARFHLTRHPDDRPAVLAVARALRAGDPDGLIDQIRARCVAEIDADEPDA